MQTFLPLMCALVLNAAANVMMKVGSKTSGTLTQGASFSDKLFNFLNAATIIAILLFAGNVLLYRKALDAVNISVAYPIMVGGGLALITLAAVLLPVLHERVSALQVAGMVVIAIGVWLVTRGQ